MSTTIKISLKDKKVLNLPLAAQEEESERNTDRMEVNTSLEDENLANDESTESQTNSKASRKSSRAKKKRFFYASDDDYEQEGELENIIRKTKEVEIPNDDIDDIINDGSEENTNIETEDNSEKDENIDIYQKMNDKVSQKNKRSKKKKFPLEPDDEYEEEIDYEFIEENNEEVQDNIAYDDLEDLMYEDENADAEVVIKGEPVTEDFEDEEALESNETIGSKTNQTKIKISLKDKTVTDISSPSEPEVYTEIDEEEGEFEDDYTYEDDIEIKTENYDTGDSSNNIQIENTFTEAVKTEEYVEGDPVDEDHDDILYEEEEFELHDDFMYEEDIKTENPDFLETRNELYKEPKENTVSAIKISLKDKKSDKCNTTKRKGIEEEKEERTRAR